MPRRCNRPRGKSLIRASECHLGGHNNPIHHGQTTLSYRN
jgi:hypothetical protein